MSLHIINLLEKGLDGAYKRQQAINDNIANINTPNYKRKDVNFIDQLENEYNKRLSNIQLNTTHHSHRSKASRNMSFNIRTETGSSYKNDENNVDIDSEMAKSAKNNLYYNTLVNQINAKAGRLRTVIERGGN